MKKQLLTLLSLALLASCASNNNSANQDSSSSDSLQSQEQVVEEGPDIFTVDQIKTFDRDIALEVARKLGSKLTCDKQTSKPITLEEVLEYYKNYNRDDEEQWHSDYFRDDHFKYLISNLAIYRKLNGNYLVVQYCYHNEYSKEPILNFYDYDGDKLTPVDMNLDLKIEDFSDEMGEYCYNNNYVRYSEENKYKEELQNIKYAISYSFDRNPYILQIDPQTAPLGPGFFRVEYLWDGKQFKKDIKYHNTISKDQFLCFKIFEKIPDISKLKTYKLESIGGGSYNLKHNGEIVAKIYTVNDIIKRIEILSNRYGDGDFAFIDKKIKLWDISNESDESDFTVLEKDGISYYFDKASVQLEDSGYGKKTMKEASTLKKIVIGAPDYSNYPTVLMAALLMGEEFCNDINISVGFSSSTEMDLDSKYLQVEERHLYKDFVVRNASVDVTMATFPFKDKKRHLVLYTLHEEAYPDESSDDVYSSDLSKWYILDKVNQIITPTEAPFGDAYYYRVSSEDEDVIEVIYKKDHQEIATAYWNGNNFEDR